MKRLLLLPLFFVLLATSYYLLATVSIYAVSPDCTYDGNPTRPGGDCAKQVPFVHSATDKYGITMYCPLTPAVKEKKEVCNASPSLVRDVVSGIGGGELHQGYANVTLFENLDNASMGGYGPDSASWGSLTLDQLATIYPYNGLADKPLNSQATSPRESFRTFWRLSSLRQQINAKAAFFDRFKSQNPPIFDSEFPYVPPAGTPTTTNPDGTVTVGSTDANLANSPAEIVGPELAYFDIGGQQNVNNNVLVPNNFTGPTAAIQAINLVTESPYNPVGDINSNVSLRIAGIQPDTSIDQIKSYATALSNSNVFKSGTVVIFGNEDNSLDVEYIVSGAVKNSETDLRKAARDYGAQYVAFAKAITDHNKFKVAPAPPDLYNGDWNPVPWVDEFNKYLRANNGCQYTDTLVANVFDVASRVGTANLDTWQYLESHICSGLKVTRFGGWGAWPGSQVVDQVKFLNEQKIPDQITAATTLIVPNCGGNSVVGTPQFGKEWWYYARGRVFKADGSEVDPNNCSTSALPANASTFKISELMTELPGCLTQYPAPDHCKGVIAGTALSLIGISDSPENAYQHLNPLTKAKYEAFQPFDFDNVRGYIALQYLKENGDPLDTTEAVPGDGGKRGSAVLAENLPYVLALDDILNAKASGIINMISPQYFNGLRLGTRAAGDVYTTDTTLEYATKEDYDYLVDKSKLTWLPSVFPSDMHDGPEGCFAQGGPILEAPMTYPQRVPLSTSGKYTDAEGQGNTVGQKQWVPVQYTVIQDDEKCGQRDPITNEIILGTGWNYTFDIWEGGALERNPAAPLVHWAARALITFSNPVQRAINYSISDVSPNGNLSLYGMMLTEGSDKTLWMPDLPFGAKHTQKQIPMLGPWIDYDQSNSNGVELKGVGGKGELSAAYMARDGGTAEINLCAIRNFWLRPSGLQKGTVDDCWDTQNLVDGVLPQPPTLNSDTTSCTIFNSGIKSGALQGIITAASQWSKVPVGILTLVLKKEAGCVDNPTDQTTICNATDADIIKYSQPGAQHPRNCSVGGPFTFQNSGTYDEWSYWKNAVNDATGENRTPEICNIKDSIYAAAQELAAAAGNGCAQPPKKPYSVPNNNWGDVQTMKNAVSGWASGCMAVCTHPFAQYYCDQVDSVKNATAICQ